LTGVVHAEAIASPTHFCRIAGARETAVGGRRFCATIEDVIATVAFLIVLEAGIDEILTVTVVDTVFHGHMRGVSVTGPREGATVDIIPTDER
jgi:hypothetical protein